MTGILHHTTPCAYACTDTLPTAYIAFQIELAAMFSFSIRAPERCRFQDAACKRTMSVLTCVHPSFLSTLFIVLPETLSLHRRLLGIAAATSFWELAILSHLYGTLFSCPVRLKYLCHNCWVCVLSSTERRTWATSKESRVVWQWRSFRVEFNLVRFEEGSRWHHVLHFIDTHSSNFLSVSLFSSVSLSFLELDHIQFSA